MGEGLAYDGESFWMSSNWSDKIYNLSVEGAVLKEFMAPSGYPFGMAYDGRHLWLADGADQIFKLTGEGQVLCQFSVPTDFPGGLAWGDRRLWLSEYPGGNRCLFGIDPAASCDTGTAVLTDMLQTPGEGSWGLGWDGAHLLVAGDRLYRLTVGGAIRQAYDLPVKGVKDIAWDGSGVWMVNSGPKSTRGRGLTVGRFKLRPILP